MQNQREYTLITGGSSGIGFELAKIFAENGHNLILVARHQSDLMEAQHKLSSTGVHIITFIKDLFDTENAFSLYEDVKSKGLKVNILVNNAGQGQYGLFEETDIRRELEIIQLNISSLVILTKLFLKDMLVRGEGKILNLASIASKIPGPWQSVYHGTKSFVLSFTEAVRSEVKDRGIVITALLPGATDTDFFNKANMNESKMVQDKSQLSDPADVARDGYEALMEGDDKVISGFKNKVMVGRSNITSDENAADWMNKQQGPVDDEKA